MSIALTVVEVDCCGASWLAARQAVYEEEQRNYYILSSFWAELDKDQVLGKPVAVQTFDMHNCTLQDVQVKFYSGLDGGYLEREKKTKHIVLFVEACRCSTGVVLGIEPPRGTLQVCDMCAGVAEVIGWRVENSKVAVALHVQPARECSVVLPWDDGMAQQERPLYEMVDYQMSSSPAKKR